MSARQRHSIPLQNCREGATDTKGIEGTKASKRYKFFTEISKYAAQYKAYIFRIMKACELSNL